MLGSWAGVIGLMSVKPQSQNTFVPTPSLVPHNGFGPFKMIWSSQNIDPIISCFGSIWGFPNVIGPAYACGPPKFFWSSNDSWRCCLIEGLDALTQNIYELYICSKVISPTLCWLTGITCNIAGALFASHHRRILPEFLTWKVHVKSKAQITQHNIADVKVPMVYTQ